MFAQTGLGTLRGASEGSVLAFRGVPYAAAPTGARRFAPPEAAAPWEGIRDATRDGPIAPQAPSRLRDAMGDFAAPQDEDCLTLTIWTPATDGGARPVLVWLHGRGVGQRRGLARLVRWRPVRRRAGCGGGRRELPARRTRLSARARASAPAISAPWTRSRHCGGCARISPRSVAIPIASPSAASLPARRASGG